MNNSGHVYLLRRAKPDEVSGLPRSAATAIRNLFPTWSPTAVDFLAQCLRTDPDARPKCLALLQHPLFLQDGFADRFLDELRRTVAKESARNPLAIKRNSETSSRICRSSIGRSLDLSGKEHSDKHHLVLTLCISFSGGRWRWSKKGEWRTVIMWKRRPSETSLRGKIESIGRYR